MKLSETACCAICIFANEENGVLVCKKKGNVNKSDVCKRYKFNPFSQRPSRPHKFDASVFDPLDFKI